MRRHSGLSPRSTIVNTVAAAATAAATHSAARSVRRLTGNPASRRLVQLRVGVHPNGATEQFCPIKILSEPIILRAEWKMIIIYSCLWQNVLTKSTKFFKILLKYLFIDLKY